MEEMEIFSFNDFLNNKTHPVKESEVIKEKEIITEKEILELPQEDKIENQDKPDLILEDIKEEEPIVEERKLENLQNDSDYYILYKDISEEFVCDISIDGVSEDDSEARIVVESKDWMLMFPGEIKNKKCRIPIKGIKLLNEGEIGKIKLEVIADGNFFIPWEDEFKVKISRKVEAVIDKKTKSVYKPVQERVKVNIRR